MVHGVSLNTPCCIHTVLGTSCRRNDVKSEKMRTFDEKELKMTLNQQKVQATVR